MRLLDRILLLSLLAVFSAGLAAAERTTYYVPNAQGSPIAAMDEQGNVLWRENYAPYGERRVKAAANSGNPSYTGKPEDTDTGLVYMGARWYDPAAGRFTGIDPQGFSEGNPQSFGRYLYANNSPYIYVDPNGEVPVLIPVAVFLAKEGAGFAFEAVTGLPPVFSLTGLAKAIKPDAKDLASLRAGSNGTVLWSGSRSAKHEAEAFAKQIDGKTLERTEAGKRLEQETKGMPWEQAREKWASVSRDFAGEAEGVVDVFAARSGISKASIFVKEELSALKNNSKVTGILIHPAGSKVRE